VSQTNRVFSGSCDTNMFLSPILKIIKKIHVLSKKRGRTKRKYLADLESVTRILNVTWHQESLPTKTKTWPGLQRSR